MFTVIDRGREEYNRTLYFQRELVKARIENEVLGDSLIFVEHDAVYTLGRGEPTQAVVGEEFQQVPWIETNRGGQATFHGPGQLVVYPVFDLSLHGQDVHVFLRKLEQAIVGCLAEFGITAATRAGLTGVWVQTADGQHKKIASIGIGVKRWISYHGLALNVSTDLRYFQAISPCGQLGEVMTSLAELLGEENCPKLPAVKDAFVRAFSSAFVPTIDVSGKEMRKPRWLRAQAGGSKHFGETDNVVRKLKLVTVCEEARCPNIGECWSHHTATFMIMGELCTRRCNFCSVKDGTVATLNPLDPLEPLRVAKAIEELGLKHVVITSVNRDDLDDMGALHFHQTVQAIAKLNPDCDIELLIPDMQGRRELLEIILQSGRVKVLNHNVETVPRLYRQVRPGAKFERSLNILRWARELQPEIKTKSGLMVGLGEQREEVLALMASLREVDVNILTIGQYLRPTVKQLAVYRFVTPYEFEEYEQEGLLRGFSHVESGAFVRSSYHAWKHVGPKEVLAAAAEV